MKKYIIALLCVAVGILLVSSMVMAAPGDGNPGNGIKKTSHDLSSQGGNLSHNVGDANEQAGLDRICIYCHAPHNAVKVGSADAAGVGYLPLWNHKITTTVFQTYNNGPDDPSDPNHLSAAEILAGQPGSVSKLCLSCHDGTVAVNQYGNAPSSSRHTGADKLITDPSLTGRGLIGGGGDLSNHHPIGFDYAAVQATDDEIAPVTASLGVYKIGDLLWAGKMECTTCHDVHNTKNQGEKFLWVSDQNSNLCLTCHLKNQ